MRRSAWVAIGVLAVSGVGFFVWKATTPAALRDASSTWLADQDEPDRDGDLLPDALELELGTDPDNPDTDGDALPDGWEVRRVGGVDLKALGADPLRRDIFVEMDYMKSPPGARYEIKPSPAVLERIKAVFRNGPKNKHGKPDIALHLELGEELEWQEKVDGKYLAKCYREHFDQGRVPMFHYMVWAWKLEGSSASGMSRRPAVKFLVTLGPWDGGTDDEKVGTFLHELGHNMGLDHGGHERTKFKPNYFSVMNYAWQFSGVPRDGHWHYEFQGEDLPTLDERRLRETVGLGPAFSSYKTIVYRVDPDKASFEDGTALLVEASKPIDWNGDGDALDDGIKFDVNYDTYKDPLKSLGDLHRKRLVFDGDGVLGKRERLDFLREHALNPKKRKPFVKEPDKAALNRLRPPK